MAAVGKRKKYKRVYVKKSKSASVLPFLLGAGVLAYFLLNRSASATVETTTVLPPGPTDTGIPAPNTGVTPVNTLPPISPNQADVLPAVNTVAMADRDALLRDTAGSPAINAAIKQMSSKELVDTYNYYYSYFINGRRLYQYPPTTGSWPDGDWNTPLFNGIAAIQSKYNIFK